MTSGLLWLCLVAGWEAGVLSIEAGIWLAVGATTRAMTHAVRVDGEGGVNSSPRSWGKHPTTKSPEGDEGLALYISTTAVTRQLVGIRGGRCR